MNRRNVVLTSMLLSVGFLTACQQDAEQAPGTEQKTTAVEQPKVVDLAPAPTAGLATGSVVETMDAGGYTYAMVNVDGKQLWAAGPTTPMKVGDTITFSTMIPMQNFHSKAMNRDFPVLYFVDGFSNLSSTGSSSTPSSTSASAAPAPATADLKADVSLENIEKAEGGYTIAEILEQRNDLSDKPVKVRGKVTKVVTGIMGKNWLHISDSSGDNDFIVTTSGIAATGQTILAEGAIALNRDFGYGYKYDILMENAQVTVE
ncbi:MAG: DNA-binding protein [Pseudomonadota bacterium]